MQRYRTSFDPSPKYREKKDSYTYLCVCVCEREVGGLGGGVDTAVTSVEVDVIGLAMCRRRFMRHLWLTSPYCICPASPEGSDNPGYC